MHLLLIRHAESANNAIWSGDADAFYGSRHHDPELTPRGVEQAARLAEHLAAGGEGRIDALAASPMTRAVQTAAPAAAALGLPLAIDVDVFEQGGLFTGDPRVPGAAVGQPGLGRAALEALSPGCAVPDGVGEDGWWRAGHEDAETAMLRVDRAAVALRGRAAATPELRLAVVTHGGFGSMLLATLLGAPPRTAWFHLHNTAISHVELAGEETVLHAHNRLAHLGEVPSLAPPMAAL